MTDGTRKDIAKLLADMDTKMAAAKRRVGNVKGADRKPAPGATLKVRPTGGLNLSGVKATWEKKW